MSRKARTTLQLRLRIPLPPNAKVPELISYIKDCLAHHTGEYPNMQGLQTNEITVSLEKRETVYF